MSSDASLLKYPASLVRPQGLKGGGMAGINVGAGSAVFFGAIRTDDDEHGEPMVITSTGVSVKVTPFSEYPAKGRATGGVRAQRFLKGETRCDWPGSARARPARPATAIRWSCPEWTSAATAPATPTRVRTWSATSSSATDGEGGAPGGRTTLRQASRALAMWVTWISLLPA